MATPLRMKRLVEGLEKGGHHLLIQILAGYRRGGVGESGSGGTAIGGPKYAG